MSDRTAREVLDLFDRIAAIRARRTAQLDAQIAMLERARTEYPLVIDRELARLRAARDASIDTRQKVCLQQVTP